LSQLVTVNREKGTFPSQPKPNLNVGPSSIHPPVHDNVKRVNAITSLRLSHLIDHSLEDLVDIPIPLSSSLSPPSVSENDSVSRDATEGTPIDSSPSQPTDLVDPEETKQDESKMGNDTPLTDERVHKPTTPFPNRLRNRKD